MSEIKLNHQTSIEIDVDPGGVETFVKVGQGFESASTNLNENVFQSTYIGDNGWGSSEVTGGQVIISLAGKRYLGDVLQDFIFDPALMLAFGEARKTSVKVTVVDSTGAGYDITCPVTIANVNVEGGSAVDPADCSFEIHLNGEPTVTTITP